jgi:hypothetical protein
VNLQVTREGHDISDCKLDITFQARPLLSLEDEVHATLEENLELKDAHYCTNGAISAKDVTTHLDQLLHLLRTRADHAAASRAQAGPLLLRNFIASSSSTTRVNKQVETDLITSHRLPRFCQDSNVAFLSSLLGRDRHTRLFHYDCQLYFSPLTSQRSRPGFAEQEFRVTLSCKQDYHVLQRTRILTELETELLGAEVLPQHWLLHL